MVSNRCKAAVKEVLSKLNLHYIVVDLGEVDIMETLNVSERDELKLALLYWKRFNHKSIYRKTS